MDPLRIYFRQHQLTDIDNNNQNVVVDCGTIATYIPGNVDPNWYEMTDFTEGLEKFQSSWDAVNQGDSGSSETNASGSNYDKGISLNLTFSGDAFNFIWDWLLTTECQILNAIDVRIDDVLAGKSFRLFEIKSGNLDYQPYYGNDEIGVKSCRIDVQLREQDLVWHCVHKTFIWDDWQKWFNSDGTSTKEHPTFLTCIEPRPRLISSVRLAFVYFINSIVNSLTVGGHLNFIKLTNIDDDVKRILNIDNFVPAPLIRDYIDNVAGKCGLATDTIFHRVGTPEYNACIYHPLSGQMYENDGDNEISPSTAFIFENRWDITLAELLDKLKLVYSAEWYVTPNNTVVFKPTQELIELSPIADFTTGLYSVRNLTYTFDGTKKPAYGRYQYQPDGSDMGSQEISNLYNDLTDFDGPSNNPMLEGELNKSFEFAPTAFVRDGRTKDYISSLLDDAETATYILLGIFGVIGAFLLVGVLSAGAGTALLIWLALCVAENKTTARNLRNHYEAIEGSYTGAVRMVTANQTLMPRILYWDGVNKQCAKVMKVVDPDANDYYNPDAVPYTTNNDISKDNPQNNIFNYQAYFDSYYTGNLFDRFHDNIDNPLKSLEKHQSFSFDTDLCPDAMNLFGVWEGDFVKIGYVLVLERRANYTVYGRIENVSISYEDYTIKVKGKVIRNSVFLPPNPIPSPTPVPTGFDFEYGATDLDTTGAAPTEADYISSVDAVFAGNAESSGSEPASGDDVAVTFDNSTDKVLFIEVPASEAAFTLWSEVGNALQQNMPIDQSFGAGGNVWFKSTRGTDTIYLTRSQTSFAGAIVLSR